MAEIRAALRFTATLGKTPKEPPRTLLLELDLTAPNGVSPCTRADVGCSCAAGWLVG